MPSDDTIDVLNRVLVILRRSFPQYLRFGRPYIPPGRKNVMETIEEVAAGQDALAARVAEQIFQAGSLPNHGKFPIEFTDTHKNAFIAPARRCSPATRRFPRPPAWTA